VIYEQKDVPDQPSELDESRTEWMRLCNAHQVDQLVSRLYASNAFYYNRGRLLQGTKAITKEYSYMSNPNYSLKLTPKHVAFVTPDIAYEIGQCSGSYPNPYMLLWEKEEDGRWVILMDSND
jgi:ketosteroid isomerase-like protein